MDSSRRLPMRTKLAFGVGAAAEAAITIAFNTWNFLFYNNVLGLSGVLCGLAVTFSLVLDAVVDPVIGSLSDRWRSKWGRRHPFLFIAPIPLAIAFYLLYAPPENLHGVGLFLWFTIFATLQRQALSLYQVPHLALGAELSTDYRERSVVMSYNAIFAVVGGAATFFFGWTWFGKIGGTSVRTGYAPLAAIVATFSAIAIFASAYFTRDQIPRLVQPPADQPRFTPGELFRQIGRCMRNRNYLMLLLGLFFLSAAAGTRETLTSYEGLFYWALPPEKIRVYGLVSPFAFVLAFVFTARLHGWFDKRETLICSAWLMVVAASTPVLARMSGHFPKNGAPSLFPMLLLCYFLLYAAIAVFTITVLSALADVADEHELNTGLRQEGVFYAARTFFAKLTSGLGHILAGLAIDIIHFPAGAKPGHVAQDVLFKLGLISGPIAAIPALIAIGFYTQYRITKHMHVEIQHKLLERRQAALAIAESTPSRAASAAEPAPG